jgi:iron complex transport system permease protein
VSKTTRALLILLPVIVAAAAVLSLCVGSTGASVFDGLRDALTGNTQSAAYRILMFVRLPRTLGALLAGMAFSVSGVLIQAMLYNPLAGPNIIGVNAGAGFFAVLALALWPASNAAAQLLSFIGALLAALLIYAIAYRTGAARITIVLAGIAVSGILSAGIDALLTFFPDVTVNYHTFIVGSLTGVTLAQLSPVCYFMLGAVLLALFLGRDTDALMLGDETAASLSVNVKLLRFMLIAAAALLAGGAVSFSGLMGFIGLIVPHMMRRVFGTRTRTLVYASAFSGALLLLVCDTLARTLFAPYELPVGILTALLGGPVFIKLLLGSRKRSRS